MLNKLRITLVCIAGAMLLFYAGIVLYWLTGTSTEGELHYATHAELPASLVDDIPPCATDIHLYYFAEWQVAYAIMCFSFKPEEFEAVKNTIATYKADEEPQNENGTSTGPDTVPSNIDTEELTWWDCHPDTPQYVKVYKIDKTTGVDFVSYYLDPVKSKCYIIRSKM